MSSDWTLRYSDAGYDNVVEKTGPLKQLLALIQDDGIGGLILFGFTVPSGSRVTIELVNADGRRHLFFGSARRAHQIWRNEIFDQYNQSPATTLVQQLKDALKDLTKDGWKTLVEQDNVTVISIPPLLPLSEPPSIKPLSAEIPPIKTVSLSGMVAGDYFIIADLNTGAQLMLPFATVYEKAYGTSDPLGSALSSLPPPGWAALKAGKIYGKLSAKIDDLHQLMTIYGFGQALQIGLKDIPH